MLSLFRAQTQISIVDILSAIITMIISINFVKVYKILVMWTFLKPKTITI